MLKTHKLGIYVDLFVSVIEEKNPLNYTKICMNM